MSKTITKSELFDLIDEDGAIQIDESPTKHDCSLTTYVVPLEGKMWEVKYECSYNEGILGDKFSLYEVEPVEVVKIEWRRVK